MTPAQVVKRSYQEARSRLLVLSKESIRMSNYETMLNRYQRLLLEVIDCGIALADVVDNALPAPTVPVVVGEHKEK